MSTKHTGLANVLFGSTRSRVLAMLYGRTEQRFFTRQIIREAKASPGAVQRELATLSKVGLIVRTTTGNMVFYQANRSASIFPEMRSIVLKTVGVFNILKSVLQPFSKQIIAAFVYGSMAREEETEQSDVDIMFVGKIKLEAVLSILSETEHSIHRPINATVYSPEEFRSKLENSNHFLATVLKGKKVFLIGDEDELGKVGRIRMAKAGGHKS